MIPVDDGAKIKIIIKESKDRGDKSAALVWAHSGGEFGLTAAYDNNMITRLAYKLNCIAFNVDYRLASIVKAPGGARDFMHAFLHVYENAKKFNIDSSKIVIAGNNSGGHICLGAAYQLTLINKGHLPKLMFLGHPQLSLELANPKSDDLKPHEIIFKE